MRVFAPTSRSGQCLLNGSGRIAGILEKRMRDRTESSSSAAGAQQSERERLRQVYVNRAFANLRKILPSYPVNKKMSKHEILRGAIHYISFLEQVRASQERSVLVEHNEPDTDESSDVND